MIQMTILILFSITGERIELKPKFVQEPSIYEELSRSLEEIKTIIIEAKERKRMGFRTEIEKQKIAGKWEEMKVNIDEIIKFIEKEKKKMERIGSGKGVRRAKETIKQIQDGKKRMEKFIAKGDFESLEEEIKKAIGPEPEPIHRDPYDYKERTEPIEPFEGFEGLKRSEPTPEDTMSTSAAEITQEIIKKAQELGNNPINIFNYVKNEIHYVPYYGSMKGSQGVLYESSGNDCDQAGFLIALLRSLGIPARFVRGIIHLSVERAIEQFGGNDENDVTTILTTAGIPYSAEEEDGEVKYFRIEWFWVTTYIPYQRYGGSREDEKGKVWVELFPSLEKKDIELGLNIPGLINFDAMDFLRNHYKEIHTSPLEVYRGMIIDTLNAHFPDNEYQDALMKIEKESEEFLILPLSKPVEVEVVIGEYTGLPSSICWKLHININMVNYVNVWNSLSKVVNTSSIFSRNLSIIWVPASFEDSTIVDSYGGLLRTPPYLISVKPLLRSNGENITYGNESGCLGARSYLTVNLIEPDRSMEFEFNCGTMIDLSLFFTQSPANLFFSNPPENEGITPREEKLYNTGVKWAIMKVNAVEEIASSMNIIGENICDLGMITSNAPFLMYGWPLNFSWQGLIINIPCNALRLFDPYSTGNKKDFWFLYSLQCSYLENKVFEEYFGVEAISATKCITVAESLDIAIYSITKGGAEPFIIPDVGATSRSREFKMGKPLTKLDFPEKSINQIIVKIKKGYKVEEIIKDGKILESDGRRGYLIEVSDVRASIDKLKREKGVEYAEENVYCFVTGVRGTAPNDPLFPEQWSMRRILAPSVWDSTTGDTNIVIGLLDTGIDTGNVEFSGRIKNGYDFVNDDSIPFDDNCHGTEIAGIIGAKGNNGTGIAGIGWNLSLLPVKVFNADGWGANWDIGQGIMFACDSGARVINMSFGGYESSSYIEDAVDYAYGMGCILVGAVGNDNIFSPLYPAAYDNVIAVSATDRDDRKAWFTNYGGYIFCSAPGVGIYTTMLDNEYGLMSGTSASSAIVSGMIGLLLSKEPYLTPDEVMQRIQDYSDDIGLPGWDNVCGYGRINGFKLLFGDIPSYLALYGWEISGGNNNGYPEKGETFILKPTIKNTGVIDTLRGVYCIISVDDSLVEIVDDICGIGDLKPGEALKSPDGFSIKFSSGMPDKYISHYGITIQDTMGSVFTDELTLKEGDLLSMLDYEWEDIYYKAVLNAWIQAGYEVIVPSRLVPYHSWHDIGFIARNPWKGSAAMLIFTTTYGGVTVVGIDGWPVETRFIFREGCIVTEIIPDILAPEEDVVYHKGDTMGVTVQYAVTYLCDTVYVQETITENYSINTSSLSPDKHYLYAVGRLESGEEVKDSIPVWVFDFEIRENLVDKYFNPLKPDSGRVAYRLLPEDYADPDISPSPINLKVEIRDKDDLLVYGARELTIEEQRNQVLYWDGMGNGGDTLDPERGPFEGELKLRYREVRGEEGVVSAEFVSNLIDIDIDNIVPDYGKVVAVRGDKVSFDYEITPSWLDIMERRIQIFEGDDEELRYPIYTEELPSSSGSFEWDGVCNETHGKNEAGHYADPGENSYGIYMRIDLEVGTVYHYVFYTRLMDIDIVPEIVKVIGTHTPFASNASCDELNPLELTNICVIKGKIDDSGDEEEDILYYTLNGGETEIWNGRDYYKNDANYNSHGTRYWIEKLNAVEIKDNWIEEWDNNFGDIDIEWVKERGPDVTCGSGWSWNYSYNKPGTYVYKITATNKAGSEEIQKKVSPQEKVFSSPENVPSGTIENIQDCYMVHLKGVEDDAYGWAQSLLSVPFNDQSPYPRDYHGTDCSGLIHISEFLKRWKQQSCIAHTYVTNTLYSSAVGEMNPDDSLDVERCDWAGIDEKIDMDGDGKVGEDPPGDMNGDGYPGVQGQDDDEDGLTDEDSRGRQPGESGYSNDLAEDDDEDGYYDSNTQEIEKLNEDPGGFDNTWDHIIMIRDYEWKDWTQPGNERYQKTLGHVYNFIHAHGPYLTGLVEEHDQFHYKIRFAWDYQWSPTRKVWNIYFRSPNRP